MFHIRNYLYILLNYFVHYYIDYNSRWSDIGGKLHITSGNEKINVKTGQMKKKKGF